jgi:hypothetical protein
LAGAPVSSTYKTDRQDITETLLKMGLNNTTIKSAVIYLPFITGI